MNAVRLLVALLLLPVSAAAQSSLSESATVVRGDVVEVQSVDAYTYLRIRSKDGEIWAAVPKANVQTGSNVAIGSSMTLRNFESKTLKKTFDKILFGVMVDADGKAVAPKGTTSAEGSSAPTVKVAKASGPDAKNIAEVIAGKDVLKDRAVLVRAKVTKVNKGILGKNWLHLQDGSGSATDKTNDILVTTQDDAAVGDVVTVKGTVRKDVNFGAGYAYPVLIENAAVRK